MGNICRSPTAEAVMRRLVTDRGLEGEVEVDSAGTGAWHLGDPPDLRAQEAATRRGVTLSGVARQVSPDDFFDYDLVLAMDDENLADLRRLAPPGTEGKLRRLTDVDVPDPYYGGTAGFEAVLDIVDRGCRELLDELGYGGLRQA
jgi:protein-tyrosine phosphatase